MEFKNHRSGNSNREKEIDFSETAVFFSSVSALKFPEKRKKKSSSSIHKAKFVWMKSTLSIFFENCSPYRKTTKNTEK